MTFSARLEFPEASLPVMALVGSFDSDMLSQAKACLRSG